jgi:hypothetical protein
MSNKLTAKVTYSMGCDEYVSFRCSACNYKSRIMKGEDKVCQSCGHDDDNNNNDGEQQSCSEVTHIGTMEGGD